MTLFTIGYEGQTFGAFVRQLKKNGVEAVIDVREIPLSRKKGFSKTAMSQALAENGIAYHQYSSLGCPKDIRKRFYEDNDWEKYTEDFHLFLSQQSDEIERLAGFVADTNSSLLCFEQNAFRCHRSIVAKAIENLISIKTVHIGIKSASATRGKGSAGQSAASVPLSVAG